MKILNTIKFKLMAWFTISLIFSTFTTLTVVNLTIESHNNRPRPIRVQINRIFQTQEEINQEIQDKIQEDRVALRNKVLLVSGLTITLQVILAAFGSYLILKYMLSPLEELNKLMNEINEKFDYTSLKINADSDELVELIQNFNSMIGRLNKAFKSQKQFVENVSHEIKTPLTIIKSNLDSIIMDEDISKKDLKKSIEATIESIKFLNKLTEDLLLFSFLENQSISKDEVSIDDLVKEIQEENIKIAKDKKIKINSIFDKSKKIIHANKTLVKRAIANIIENAVKYSKNSSKINIAISKDESRIRITVDDEAEKIAEEFREKIFERFFRIDKSRSRQTGGVGLGLAITREIIELYGGKIFIETTEVGNRFVIEF